MHCQQSVKNTKRINMSPSYFGKGLTFLMLLNIARKKMFWLTLMSAQGQQERNILLVSTNLVLTKYNISTLLLKTQNG